MARLCLLVVIVAAALPCRAASVTWTVADRFTPFAGLAEDRIGWWMLQPRPGAAQLESFDEWYARVSGSGKSPFAEIDEANRGWDEKEHRYRENYLKWFVHPRAIDVIASVPGETGACSWLIDGKAAPPESCAHARLAIPVGGATVTVKRGETQLAEARIAPEHVLVLGIGDSYASGEGNPDTPTGWKSEAVPEGDYDWLWSPSKGDKSHVATPAQWWDQQCHRSFWNHQTYLALKLAAEDPHRQVAFLQYSCSGAEVFDGLLARQIVPPGSPAACSGTDFTKAECRVAESQLHAAARDLCDTPGAVKSKSPALQEVKERIVGFAEGLDRANAYSVTGADLVACEPEHRRVPDVVLLSVGGADIGLPSLDMWAILPARARAAVGSAYFQIGLSSKVVCPEKAQGVNDWKCREPFDYRLASQLGRRYDALFAATRQLLGVASPKIVMPAYPNPLVAQDAPPVTYCANPPDAVDNDNPWDGARSVTKLTSSQSWELNLTADEAKILSTSTIPRLNTAIGIAAKQLGFRFATETAAAFRGHAWCATSDPDSPVWLPSRGKSWLSGTCSRNPSCWQPFKPRARYIRTVNDSLLTQTSQLDDGLTGAFSPTAQGQAAIAAGTWPAFMQALQTKPAKVAVK